MNTIYIKIMHLASGLFSIGTAALFALFACFTAFTAGIIWILVVAIGFLAFGVPAFAWGFLSLIRGSFVTYPKEWIEVGLVVLVLGLIGVLMS